MPSHNGESSRTGALELRDVLMIQTTDNKQLEFEVMGLVEDEDKHTYAVCYCETEDEFVVTDSAGRLLSDDELAQEILDDFITLAEEAAPPERAE
jgi:hypothetical protein